MLSTMNITGFALVLMRMTGSIFMNPILGRTNFPAMFKSGLVLMLTILVMTCAPPGEIPVNTTAGLAVLMLKEFMVGYVIGFICNLFSYVISFSGELMDQQMGMAMSKIYDPASNVSLSLSATLFNIMYLLMFFAVNGHLTLIRLILDSGEAIPYGNIHFTSMLTQQMTDVFTQCTILALKMAMPIVAIQFLMEVAVGILMKAIPQINVFVVNMQMKMIVGFILFVLLMTPMSDFLENLIQELFQAISDSFYVMH